MSFSTRWPAAAAALLLTAFLFAASASADTVTLYTNQYSDFVSQLGGDGGEFTAITGAYSSPTSKSALLSLGYTNSTILQAAGQYGFETFCLQQTVTVKAGSPYTYTTTDTFSPNGPLTQGVAWLYDQFATGVLSGYNYTNASARTTDAAELQAAIWYLQGETPYNGYTGSTITGDPFISDVITQFTSLTNAEAADVIGGYNVAVMALADGSKPGQNQLILIPPGQGIGSVPDSATTLGLLAASFASLLVLRRKLAA
jgi:hypothetical protein